jgi:hypothetical protein
LTDEEDKRISSCSWAEPGNEELMRPEEQEHEADDEAALGVAMPALVDRLVAPSVPGSTAAFWL